MSGIVEGVQQVALFKMAAAEAVKAWASTNLLSRTKLNRVDEISGHFESGNAGAIGAALVDISGASFTDYALKTGVDAKKLSDLGGLVITMISGSLVPGEGPNHALKGVERLHDDCCEWIGTGAVKGGARQSDLRKVNELIGSSAAIRLSLLAPLSPAISITSMLLRARVNKYPFAAVAANRQKEGVQ